jgi:hypothetical protein
LSNSSELLQAAISAIWRDRDKDRGLDILRQIVEDYPHSPDAVRAQSMIADIAASSAAVSGGLQQMDDCAMENQGPSREVSDWNENAGSRFARMGCGVSVVLALLTILVILALATAACGILAVFIANDGCPQDLFAFFV